MTDPTTKPEPIPSDAQIAQWEASTAMALRVLRVLAEVTTSGEMASSGYLRKRCGLSAEEWHGSGELMASLICFASDKGFLEWHARDMAGATSDPKPEPSELAKRIADAIEAWMDVKIATNALAGAISTAGLAALEAKDKAQDATIIRMGQELKAAERERDEAKQTIAEWPGVVSLHAKLDTARRERDEARGHARDHHIEACETCIAIETERNEVAARLEEVAVVLKRMARSDFNPTRKQLRSAVRLATKGEGDG